MSVTEGMLGFPFGIAQSDDDGFDKLSSEEHTKEVYRTLEKCLAIEEQPELDDTCSVEIVNRTCEIHKYYSEETSVAVQRHFTLQEDLIRNTMMNSKLSETEVPFKAPGRSRRKIMTSSTITHAPISVPLQTHPYARVAASRPVHSPPTFLVRPARVEMTYQNMESCYTTPPVPLPYCFQYKPTPSEYNTRPSCSRPTRQPAYTAFRTGKTLIEVYSPTVGRGFNPRYNSLLIQPTVQPYIPLITGQSPSKSPTQAEIQTFMHVAIEFNIPNKQ